MKKVLLLSALCTLLAVTAAWAGDTFVPSDTPSAGTCNVFPWGTNTEWRFQSYQTAAQLGNKPFVITDLSWASCGNGTLTCTDLEIRISHTSAAASSTFATNLPNPVTVLKANSFTYNFTGNVWSPIGITCPFAYNGTDNLTVEIRYKNGTRSGSLSCHRDTHFRIYASGAGSYTATTGSGPSAASLKIRFTHADLTPSTTTPIYGTTVTMLADSSADAGKFYFCASALGTGSIPIGCWNVNLATDPLFFTSFTGLAPTVFINYQGLLDASGLAKVQVAIPKIPALKGVTVYSAYLVMGASTVDSVSPTTKFTISSP